MNENLKVGIITKNVNFKDFLFTFYAPTTLALLPISKVEYFIEKQHTNKELQNLFKALYLGESISFNLREKLSTLGISHLVALSGLHLGIISGVLYFLLLPFYSIFHKFFPYRNRLFDVGIIVLIVEFLYLYYTNFPPSLIRAFLLELVIFIYAVRLKEVVSLEVLLVSVGLAFLIFDFKVFNIGYFLSVAGVYYIYLFFKYFKANFLNTIILSFYLYLVMFVVSHYFFAYFNYYQFFSPIVSLIFSIFYPLLAILHLLGIGGIFDNILLDYFSLGKEFIEVKISFFVFMAFLIASILAYFQKRFFYFLNLFALGIMIFSIGG